MVDSELYPVMAPSVPPRPAVVTYAPTVKALGQRPASAGVPGTQSNTSTHSAGFTSSEISSWGDSYDPGAGKSSRVPMPRLRPPSAEYMQGWRDRRERLLTAAAVRGRNLRSAPQLARANIRQWHPRQRPARVDEAEGAGEEEAEPDADARTSGLTSSVGLVVASARRIVSHRRTASGGSSPKHRRAASGGNLRVQPEPNDGSIAEGAEGASPAPPNLRPPSAAYMHRFQAHSAGSTRLQKLRGALARGDSSERHQAKASTTSATRTQQSTGPLDGCVNFPLDDPSGLFSREEVAVCHQLRSDFGGPPSEHKSASCVARLRCEGGVIRCWRYRQAGDRFDTYVLDVTMAGVSLRTALSMTSSGTNIDIRVYTHTFAHTRLDPHSLPLQEHSLSTRFLYLPFSSPITAHRISHS